MHVRHFVYVMTLPNMPVPRIGCMEFILTRVTREFHKRAGSGRHLVLCAVSEAHDQQEIPEGESLEEFFQPGLPRHSWIMSACA